MRAFLLLTLLAGCIAGTKDSLSGGADDGSNGSGAGPAECSFADECALAAPTCCECPTFAVPVFDPLHRSCEGVVCPPMSCPMNVRADCVDGQCTLACAPMVCSDQQTPVGYLIDTNGCLTCDRAPPPPMGSCATDSECLEVRADCCGCHLGGVDTAVLASDAAQFDANLHCPMNPACPMTNTCAPGAAARCVEGKCELLTTSLPGNACGRPDLTPCPTGCTINADPAATAEGVGVCLPAQ
jgi:hypothetical protein